MIPSMIMNETQFTVAQLPLYHQKDGGEANVLEKHSATKKSPGLAYRETKGR